MEAGAFEKQSYESYGIYADFSLNMDVSGGEDLVLGNTTVVAFDSAGTDVSTVVLDQSTKEIGGAGEIGRLKIRVRDGTEADSPYKITFKTGDTTANEKWEKDVWMTIREI